MTQPENIARIVEGLTKAQRDMLLAIRPCAVSFEYNYSCQVPRRGLYLASTGALCRRGLVPKSPDWDGPHAVESRGLIWLNLTPLGEQVRNALTGTSHEG